MLVIRTAILLVLSFGCAVAITVNDNFNSTAVNTTLWSVLTPPSDVPYSVVARNGRVEITGVPGFNGAGLITNYRLIGDFDVQVDYILLNWPTVNRHSVQLGVQDLGIGTDGGGSIGLNRVSFENSLLGTTEFYLMSLPSGLPQIATTQTSGTMRLVRIGSVLSSYISNGLGGWTAVGSGIVSTAATRINLDMGGGDATASSTVLVAFDNFMLNSGTPVFPGALPSLNALPSSLSFAYDLSIAGPVAPQTVSIISTGDMQDFTVSSLSSWLAVSLNDSRTPATATVSVARTLGVGTYHTELQMVAPGASNAHQIIPVTLTVTSSPSPAIPTITVSPSSLTFSYQEGSGGTTSRPILVQSTGAPLPFFMGTAVTAHQSILFASPGSGVTSSRVDITVDPGLHAGTYSSNIFITSSVRGGDVSRIPVSIIITPAVPPPPVQALQFSDEDRPPVKEPDPYPLHEDDVWNAFKLAFLNDEYQNIGGNNADPCYEATVYNLYNYTTKHLLNTRLDFLATTIASLPLSAFPAESILGRSLLKAGEFLISSLSGDLSETAVKFVTEETAGYILGNAVGDYVAGQIASTLSESEYLAKIISDNLGATGTAMQSNDGIEVQQAVTTARLAYNPHTHFATIGAQSVCLGENHYYLFRFEMAESLDAFRSPVIKDQITTLAVMN